MYTSSNLHIEILHTRHQINVNCHLLSIFFHYLSGSLLSFYPFFPLLYRSLFLSGTLFLPTFCFHANMTLNLNVSWPMQCIYVCTCLCVLVCVCVCVWCRSCCCLCVYACLPTPVPATTLPPPHPLPPEIQKCNEGRVANFFQLWDAFFNFLGCGWMRFSYFD